MLEDARIEMKIGSYGIAPAAALEAHGSAEQGAELPSAAGRRDNRAGS
jgi:hypothetical protein